MNTSLLKRDLSVGWKGILILLIVLGHNSILCKPSIEADHFYIWRTWLYTFHVWAFFVLPFLYGCKELNLVDIVKHAIGGKTKCVKMNETLNQWKAL